MNLHLEHLQCFTAQNIHLKRLVDEVLQQMNALDLGLDDVQYMQISERHEVDVQVVIALHHSIRSFVLTLQGNENERRALLQGVANRNQYSQLAYGFYLDVLKHARNMLDTPFQEEPRCRGKMHCLADEFLAVETKLREEVGELNTLLQMALQEHSEECSAHDRTKEEVRKLQSMLTEIAYAKARMHTLSMNRTDRWVLDTGVPAEYGEGELQYKPTFVKAYNGLPEHIQTATKMTLFQFVMQEPLRLRQMLNVKRVLSNPRNQRKTVHDWVCDVQHTTYRMVFRKQDSTIAFLYVGEHSHVY